MSSSSSIDSPKPLLDPRRAYAAVWEEELDDHGALAPTAVVFLTNKECPFRCVMCDLWVNTLDDDRASRRHRDADSHRAR